MPSPTPITLQRDVLAVIRVVAGKSQSYPLNPDVKLVGDLKLQKYQRRALAVPLEAIARGFVPGVNIGKTKCEGLRTCKEAVSLTSEAAGFDGSWV